MEGGKKCKKYLRAFFFFFFFLLFTFENDENLFWVYQNGTFLPGKKSGKMNLPLQKNMPVTPLDSWPGDDSFIVSHFPSYTYFTYHRPTGKKKTRMKSTYRNYIGTWKCDFLDHWKKDLMEWVDWRHVPMRIAQGMLLDLNNSFWEFWPQIIPQDRMVQDRMHGYGP